MTVIPLLVHSTNSAQRKGFFITDTQERPVVTVCVGVQTRLTKNV